jgi:cytosine/adenosine deaminase-related metal-dependent hydrolase
VLGRDTLCIHAVQTDAGDLAVMTAARWASRCIPLERGAPTWRGAARCYLAAGLRVGVGTDSTTSTGRNDLFGGPRRRALGHLDAAGALRLITLGAAGALA